MIEAYPMTDIQDLQRLIRTHPVIDNHSHNILKASSARNYARYPFESITSEARGSALEDHVSKSLSHQKAVGQLAELYQCAPEWQEVKSARDRLVGDDYDDLVRRCLAGTHMLLMDDGLALDNVEPYGWHDQFTTSPTKRVVRIETVAVALIRDQLRSALGENGGVSPKQLLGGDDGIVRNFWNGFQRTYGLAIEKALDDSAVVGFKSVICYRTGLEISRCSAETLFDSFRTYFRNLVERGESRIEHKPLNDYLVISLLERLRLRRARTGVSKPVQFHTGLGDADLKLVRADPAYLQWLIGDYRDVDFVLLHSSYPYTRQAGYLATVYANAYLDIGEVFPMTSRDAQQAILRQSLDLAPSSKILWSTDGHFFPETFWLANKQFRQALESVLMGYVGKEDCTVAQAMNAATDIMFNNSNRLYALDQTPDYSYSSSVPTPAPSLTSPILAGIISSLTDIPALEDFLRRNSSLEFIWMQFVDYTATVRVRMFTVREFVKVARSQRRLGITLGVLNMLQNDTLVPPSATCVGQFYLKPDLTTLCCNAGLSSNSATVMTFWHREDGGILEGCPRTALQAIVDRCQVEFGINLLFGFEIEVVIMKQSRNENGRTIFAPLLTNHSWSNMTSETRRALPLIEQIVRTLAQIDIHVEQFHAESSPGQLEFCLPPSTPLAAVDTLLKARQTIAHVAEQHGLRATLYPRPFSTSAGTAAHAHVSITPVDHEESFLAGMLAHLPAVLAFTFPQEASYARVAEGIWSGGVWVAWGVQNRETPVRKISAGHWEIKSVDGLANMYLAMTAVVAAGYLGMQSMARLEIRNCDADPATLTPNARAALNITTRLPTSLDQSIAALQSDSALRSIMGNSFIRRYVGVRRGEDAMLRTMGEEEKRNWLISKY